LSRTVGEQEATQAELVAGPRAMEALIGRPRPRQSTQQLGEVRFIRHDRLFSSTIYLSQSLKLTAKSRNQIGDFNNPIDVPPHE
jgi:hypothetical protein